MGHGDSVPLPTKAHGRILRIFDFEFLADRSYGLFLLSTFRFGCTIVAQDDSSFSDRYRMWRVVCDVISFIS